MFGWLKNIAGRSEREMPMQLGNAALARRYLALARSGALRARPSTGSGRLMSRYDAAVTTDNNRRHWANADALSADGAASPDVRRTLRNRSRYEVANNSYARGIVLTLANDTVGTGPRLQLLTGDDGINRQVEMEFDLWVQEIALPEKLRTMRMARAQDGEAFAILANNPVLDHPVKLDLRQIEADQVTAGWRLEAGGLRYGNSGTTENTHEVDGILLDKLGNPVAYRVLKNHPGATAWSFRDDFVTVPAQGMIHVFRQERPGQHRGVPEITPALPLFAQLRRFTLAVLSAAEAAANFAGILYTDAPPTGEAEAVEPMDLIELERNMLLTMPGGWKMSQIEPAQPATTYAEFKKEILDAVADARLQGSSAGPKSAGPDEELDDLSARLGPAGGGMGSTGFPPYEVYVPDRRASPAAFYTSSSEVSSEVAECVRTEGPIHEDELIRRVAAAWGISRVGSRVRERGLAAITTCLRGDRIARGASRAVCDFPG